MRNGIHDKKPYIQFIRYSNDIPSFHTSFIKNKKRKKENITTKRDLKHEIQIFINSIISDKKNIRLFSSIVCYFFVTFDKKHMNIVTIIEKYLGKHNISIPNSSEIPKIFERIINAFINQFKQLFDTKHSDILKLQNQIEHSIKIIVTDCIYHPENINIQTCSFKQRYPNILNLFKNVIFPVFQKYNVLSKMVNSLDILCTKNSNIENSPIINFLCFRNTNAHQYLKKIRNMIYHNENYKKSIGHNLYILLSNKTDKISHIPFFSQLLSNHTHDINKILKSISNNPHFTKRFVKKILGKISSLLSPNKTTSENNHNVIYHTKNILRKCRMVVNNVFVFSKIGTSLYPVGKKLENKFPGISKAFIL